MFNPEKDFEKEIEDFARQKVDDVKVLLKKEHRDFFDRIYSKGIPKNGLPTAYGQIMRTLKKYENN